MSFSSRVSRGVQRAQREGSRVFSNFRPTATWYSPYQAQAQSLAHASAQDVRVWLIGGLYEEFCFVTMLPGHTQRFRHPWSGCVPLIQAHPDRLMPRPIQRRLLYLTNLTNPAPDQN